jgi:polar amino acid transport system substrate-binding protein
MRWFLLCGLALFFAGCAKKADNRLKVGMELSYPPFEMTDASGRPTGIGVELAEALARQLGRELVIENMPFDGLIPALKTGKVHLVISSMTANTERANSIDFSNPYVHTGIAILAAKSSPVNSALDLSIPGRIIAVKKGTTGHSYAVERLPQARVLVLDKEASCVLEVTQGKADAFLYDQISVLQNWRQHQDTTRALLEPFQKESWAIGIQKGNEGLRLEVNAFLKEFKADGGFDRLAEKYLAQQRDDFRRLGFKFFFDEP